MAKASDLVLAASGQVGVRESPPGSNNVRYNTWYYGREVSGSKYPWCMVFVQWCADRAGVKIPMRTASCGALMRSAMAAGQWVEKDYRPGDILIFDFAGGARTDHCGIVESVNGADVVTIEGNTGSTSDSDGGQVQRRSRSLRLVVGAVRLNFEPETEGDEEEMAVRYNTVAECPGWARDTIQKLIDKGALNGDGTGLDLSHDMVRLLVIQDRAGAL